MTSFTAGRYQALVHLGPQNGEVTTIRQTHANGSDEITGEITVRLSELPDLRYVLQRAIVAHNQERKV